MIKHWILAARPKTLPAAMIPVFLGSAIAYSDSVFDFYPASLALICALLIQIGTNFANDYYDFKKGADNEHRIGFIRATSSGLISERTMLYATFLTMGIAFAIGLLLVHHAGYKILVIGLLSLLFGIMYTGGPYPLGYNGLGDIFVFIFFGIVAVMTTYYVQALEWSTKSFYVSLAAGALSTNILVVNNLRDVPTDTVSGKKTLGVLFGERMLKFEYTLLSILSLIVPIILYFIYSYSLFIFLPFITLPLMVKLNKEVWKYNNRSSLNSTLVKTAGHMTFFGLLFAIGIIIQ